MDLVSGSLYWPHTIKDVPKYDRLSEDICCDVVVIGGGEAGSIIAHELVCAGLDTVLVEKRTVAGGSTSANTGLLQFNNDKTLTSCIQTYGIEAGVRFYQLCYEGIGQLRDYAKASGISTQFRDRNSLYFASTEQDMTLLQEEGATLKKYGFPVEYFTRSQIEERFSFSKPAALYSTGDADVNPYVLAISLIDVNVKKGLRVYEQTEVVDHKEKENVIELRVKGDQRITTSFVVYATGYESQQMKRNKNAILESTYALATKPVNQFPGWHNECLIWETARPYLYMRTTGDGRIIAGGFDEATINKAERDAKLVSNKRKLENEIKELFPDIGVVEAEYYWAATFGSTRDGFPLIGPQPEFPRSFFALGYGGNGVVYCTIAANLIRDFIVKGSHPDAPLFAFERMRKS